MPDILHAYRVFIASPGGMADERAAFRQALNHHNEADAIERGVIFLPVGWETTPGGVGRPQELINEDVRRCDFFVLVLGDRWGSAPAAGNSKFSSGSEEEFTVASECYDQKSMRDLIVFFKTLSLEKQADPGRQLQPVLDFRKKLETEKKLLFESFDELPTLREKLQRHLARWIRDHEQGESTPRPATTPQQLSEQGLTTEAGSVLAQAALNEDLEAMHRYASLQAKAGNPSAAEASFRRLRDVAHARGDVDWEVESIVGLAGVYASLDKPGEEEACYHEALGVREAAHGQNHPSVASSLNVLAEFYSAHGRPQEALEKLERAFQIQGVPFG